MPNVSDTDSGQAGDGVYEGEIPTFPSRTRIVFYIEAVDEQGNARRFPPEAPAKTCLYMIEAPIDVPFDVYHLVLDTARLSELSRRPVHSNELVDATFVYNNKEVFYGVSVRYRGSPWGRASKNNFRVRFPKDRTSRRRSCHTPHVSPRSPETRGTLLSAAVSDRAFRPSDCAS
jgi:hypothetical protein